MRLRAQLLVGCFAILVGILLGRAGLIDAGGGSPEPVVVTLTSQPVPAGSAADADRQAVRGWLRGQLAVTSPLEPLELAQLLAVVEEDPDDAAQLRVLPSGRRMPKASGGEAWEPGVLWPVRRGLVGDPVAQTDLHNVRAVERGPGSVPDDADFADDPGPGLMVPHESVKGDIARGLFYMALRYDGSDGGARLDLVVGRGEASSPVLGELCTLLRWNEADRVDSAERRRNERVARYQGNRNPFVDRPEFARVLWGDRCR